MRREGSKTRTSNLTFVRRLIGCLIEEKRMWLYREARREAIE
jgi:hypothetical protein